MVAGGLGATAFAGRLMPLALPAGVLAILLVLVVAPGAPGSCET